MLPISLRVFFNGLLEFLKKMTPQRKSTFSELTFILFDSRTLWNTDIVILCDPGQVIYALFTVFPNCKVRWWDRSTKKSLFLSLYVPLRLWCSKVRVLTITIADLMIFTLMRPNWQPIDNVEQKEWEKGSKASFSQTMVIILYPSPQLR